MLLKYFYDKALAHASYMVGCQKIGEAIVVDPSRSVEQYLDAAKAEGLRIVGAAESHIHADFVSGSRELADRVGAKLYLEGRKRGQVGTGPFMEYGGIWTCPNTVRHDICAIVATLLSPEISRHPRDTAHALRPGP